MCLIVRCQQDIPLTDDFLKEIYRRNNNGFGMMWINNNKLFTFKQHDAKADDLIAKYKELAQYDPWIHVRMKTHGKIDHENTHPYYVGYGIWLMHNGVIGSFGYYNHDKSDTWHFINEVVRPILASSRNPHRTLRAGWFINLVEKIIGGNNRIVAGDRGGFIVFNEDAWHVVKEETTGVKGLTVSNTYAWDDGFKKPKPVYAYTPHTYHNNYVRNWVSHSSGEHFVCVDDDLYVDEHGEFWEKTLYGFNKIEDTKKKKRARRRQRLQARVKGISTTTDSSTLDGVGTTIRPTGARDLLPKLPAPNPNQQAVVIRYNAQGQEVLRYNAKVADYSKPINAEDEAVAKIDQILEEADKKIVSDDEQYNALLSRWDAFRLKVGLL